MNFSFDKHCFSFKCNIVDCSSCVESFTTKEHYYLPAKKKSITTFLQKKNYALKIFLESILEHMFFVWTFMNVSPSWNFRCKRNIPQSCLNKKQIFFKRKLLFFLHFTVEGHFRVKFCYIQCITFSGHYNFFCFAGSITYSLIWTRSVKTFLTRAILDIFQTRFNTLISINLFKCVKLLICESTYFSVWCW